MSYAYRGSNGLFEILLVGDLHSSPVSNCLPTDSARLFM